MHWLVDAILGGIAYDVFRYFVGPLMVSLIATAILRRAFDKLQERRQALVFAGGTFLVCLILFFFLGTRPQEPNLVGSIQQVMTGKGNNDRETVAIFSIGIVNTGGMQSIVKQWTVEAEANGIKYQATFVPVPKTFTFKDLPHNNDDQPEAVIFKAEDNIVEKGLLPVQTGAFLQGTLFVLFRNLDNSVLRGAVEYTVSYQDVLSRKYSMPIKGTGQFGNVPLIPGLHTEAVCRTASWPLPDATGSVPTLFPPTMHNYTPLPNLN